MSKITVIKAQIIGHEDIKMKDGTQLYCYYIITENIDKNGSGNRCGKVYTAKEWIEKYIPVIFVTENQNGKNVGKYKYIDLGG